MGYHTTRKSVVEAVIIGLLAFLLFATIGHYFKSNLLALFVFMLGVFIAPLFFWKKKSWRICQIIVLGGMLGFFTTYWELSFL